MAVDRRLVIGATAAVVVLVVLSRFWPVASSISSAPPAGTPSAARGTAAITGQTIEPAAPVKLEALTATRDEPGAAARNPFRFQPRVAPPPLRPATPPPVIELPRGPVPPAGPPPAPPIPLKFMGVLERANGVKWAALSDGKSGPMYGKEGDIIDGRYLIVKIGAESIEMTYPDGRGRQVIRLSGQ